MIPSHKHPNAILAIILTSTLMVVMDVSIVTTALPEIHRRFGFSGVGLSWVVNAYSLVFGGLLLLGARSGDLLGRRRMFRVGLALFTFASLAIGLAQSAPWLIAGRAVQGLGAAILSPATLALLTENFAEGTERTRVLALYGTVVGLATSIGLVLGGVVTTLVSWRLAFFINVPIGLALLLATPGFIVATPRAPGRFDLIGAFTSTLGMSALVYGIVHAAESSWLATETIASLSGGLALLGLFVWHESSVEEPIMPLRLFANRRRSGSYGARTLYLGVMISFWFFITQYLQLVKGFSAVQTGLAFMPMTLANFLAALSIPRMTRRIGNPRVITIGVAITLVGMVWLSRISPGSSYALAFALPLILLGAGQGLSQGPLTAEGLIGVANRDAGAASGITYVASQVGTSLALAIQTAVFAAATGAGLAGPALLTHRIAAALTVAAWLLALSLLVVVVTITRRRDDANPEIVTMPTATVRRA